MKDTMTPLSLQSDDCKHALTVEKEDVLPAHYLQISVKTSSVRDVMGFARGKLKGSRSHVAVALRRGCL